ncbi:MAG: oligosaccharide flippase family protein [Lachnospiraceae bacterium]|nr:oligosaccharide flippase family protein [Lachnospiraceae bacterium]
MKEKIKQLTELYRNISVQAKAAIWYVICNVIQKGIIFLTTPVFSRLLSTEEYGIFSVYTTWQSAILVLVSLNLASGVYLRGLIKYEEDEETFSVSLYSLFSLVFFIGFGIYLLAAGFWSRLLNIYQPYMFCMFADMLVMTAFHFWSSRQRVFYCYKSLVVITVINAIVKPLSGVIAIYLTKDPLPARIYTMTAADVLCFGWFYYQMWRGKKKVSRKYWSYALHYNLPLVPHYLSQIVLNQSDRVMIERMISSSKAGIYSLAYNLSSIVLVLNQAILDSFKPWMYRQIKKGRYGQIRKVSMGLLVLLAVANLCVILLAPELIALWGPASYSEAVWTMPPVTMSIYFMFLYNLFSNFEFYYEKTRFMMVASVSGAGLNIVLNYIFIRRFGYLAAGYTTLVCYICYCIAHYIVMRLILNKQVPGERVYKLSHILALSIGFMICGFAAMLFYRMPLVRYAIFASVMLILLIKRKSIMQILRFKKSNEGEEAT